MYDLQELIKALDSNNGIDGGAPESRYWFIGLEYGERPGYENATGNWWEWTDNYYPKIKQILDAIGADYTDAFLANLYPVRKQNTMTTNDLIKFRSLDDYYAFCDLHGRKTIKNGLTKGNKKVIVCSGLQWQWCFMLQLSGGYSAEYVKTHDNPQFIEIKFNNHPHIDRLIVIKHASRAGLKYCKAIGEHIKTIKG